MLEDCLVLNQVMKGQARARRLSSPRPGNEGLGVLEDCLGLNQAMKNQEYQNIVYS